MHQRKLPDSFELVQVAKQDSGLKFDIYLYSSGTPKKWLMPIIEIEKDKKLTPLFLIGGKEPKLYEPSNIQIDELDEIIKYINRNNHIIIEHWNGKISDKEVLNLLYKSDKKLSV